METTLQVPGRLEKSRRDHKQILDALLAGDPAAAKRAAKTHIRGARTAALSTSNRPAPGADDQR
jgi:GntR family transcriptional repressor for pyruvate dehydrogenase complex